MATSVKISIPTPCHENWGDMAPADRGRFCGACQKTVVDFTQATDREIITAYKKENNLCGRFHATQLDRDLVIPKEKNSLWAGAAAVALLSLGSGTALAQTQASTEQLQIMGKMRIPANDNSKTVSITILDENKDPFPGVSVSISQQKSAITDPNGQCSLTAIKGDTLQIEFPGYCNQELIVSNEVAYTVQLEVEETTDNALETNHKISSIVVLGGVLGGGQVIKQLPTRKRTFIGRIFHSIGNIFR